MRATVVAGIGGFIVGHVLWLIAISVASGSTHVNAWVLAIGAVSLVVGVVGALLGRKFHRERAFAKAAFLWGLPVSPVLLSLCVLGVTYL